MPDDKTDQVPKTIQVKLKTDHTHAGQDHKAGETIQIPEAYRNILKAQGAID